MLVRPCCAHILQQNALHGRFRLQYLSYLKEQHRCLHAMKQSLKTAVASVPLQPLWEFCWTEFRQKEKDNDLNLAVETLGMGT